MRYLHKVFILRFLLIVTILLLSTLIRAHAQDGTPGDPDAAPIDGGLSLLIAGGIGYGIKKIKEKRK